MLKERPTYLNTHLEQYRLLWCSLSRSRVDMLEHHLLLTTKCPPQQNHGLPQRLLISKSFFCCYCSSLYTCGIWTFPLGVEWELKLQAYTTACSNTGSLTHWGRSEMEPTSSWTLCWATVGIPNEFFLMIPLGNDRKYWTDLSPNDHEDEHLVSYVLLVLLLLLI